MRGGGVKEPTPAASGDPSLLGKGEIRVKTHQTSPGFWMRSRGFFLPTLLPFPNREGSPLAAGVGYGPAVNSGLIVS